MYGAKLFEELNDIAKKEVLKEGYKNTKLGWFEGHLYSVDEFDDGTITIQGAFPYDDAEHYWARHIDGDNDFTIYYMGRKYKEFPSTNYEDVAAELARYNKLVKPKMIHESIEDEEVEESFKSADTFTTTRGKKAFGKWFVPDDDDDGDVDKDDFMAFMKAHYSTPGLDSSNWTDDMWETARSFYNESLTEADEEVAKEKAKNFDVSKAKEGIKKCANTAKNLINNNEKLNQFLDKAEAFLSKSSSKELRKAATIISMVRDYASGAYTEIPINAIIGLVASLVYMVIPTDIIPDIIPVAGMVDDIGVVMVAIKSFDKDIDNYIAWKNNNK